MKVFGGKSKSQSLPTSKSFNGRECVRCGQHTPHFTLSPSEFKEREVVGRSWSERLRESLYVLKNGPPAKLRVVGGFECIYCGKTTENISSES